MVPDQTDSPRTAEALAANKLRSAIVRGDLAPGAKIRQEVTAAQLGLSPIPVREALKTLAGEGIVVHQPQRGYFVTELPESAIRDVYTARSLVEAAAERAALPHLLPEDTTAMRALLRVQEIAVQEHNAVDMITTNRRFHFVIFDRCDNAWLTRFVTQLWDALDPYRVVSYRHMWLANDRQLIPNEILDEHRAIVAAIENAEYALALELLQQHRERSEVFVRALGAKPGLDDR